jgi:hypothetical protein
MKTTHSVRILSYLLFFSFTIFLFSSCAQKEVVDACLEGKTYGFWYGLLHGIIAPIGFLGMLLQDDVVMYATNNNGGWYALGFLLGSGGWGILGGKTLCGGKKD